MSDLRLTEGVARVVVEEVGRREHLVQGMLKPGALWV